MQNYDDDLANEMRDLHESNADQDFDLMQDGPANTSDEETELGQSGTPSQMLNSANDGYTDEESQADQTNASSISDAIVQSNSQLGGSVSDSLTESAEAVADSTSQVSSALEKGRELDKENNKGMIKTLSDQTGHLIAISGTLGAMHAAIENEKKKSVPRTYKRDTDTVYSNLRSNDPKWMQAARENGTLGPNGQPMGGGGGLFGGAGAAGGGILGALGIGKAYSWAKEKMGFAPKVEGETATKAKPTGASTSAAPAQKGFVATKIQQLQTAARESKAGKAVGAFAAQAKTKTKAFGNTKAGKITGLAAAGVTGLLGYDAVTSIASDRIENNRKNTLLSFEEIKEQSTRKSQGLPPLAGQELIDFRSKVTTYNGHVADPNTGYPMNPLQAQAVKNGLMTPEEAVLTDNANIQAELNLAGVPLSNESTNIVNNTSNDNTISKVSSATQSDNSNLSMTQTALAGVGLVTAGKAANDYRTRNAPGSLAKPTSSISNTSVKPKIKSIGQMSTVGAQGAAANSAPSATTSTKAPIPKKESSTVTRAVAKLKGTSAAKQATKLAKGAKSMPLIGPALSAYFLYDTWSGDSSQKDKIGQTADMAGGMAGAAAGAALGLLLPVPGGALIGGVAGYFVGEAALKTARQAVFGMSEEEAAQEEDADKAIAEAAKALPAVTGSLTENTNNASMVGDTTTMSMSAGDSISSATNSANNIASSALPVLGSVGATYTGGDRVVNGAVSNLSNLSNANLLTVANSNMTGGTVSPINSTVNNSNPEVARASAQTKSDVEVQRSLSTSVQKVMMVNPPAVATKKEKEAFGPTKIPTSGTYSSGTIHPRIDDAPAIVNDAGLALLNTGFI